MNGLNAGAKKTPKVDGRDDWARNARGPHAAESDHLRRLCASIGEAVRLISLSRGGMVDEEDSVFGRARSLDMLAFTIAVDTVLFLGAVGEATPLPLETSRLLGRTVRAIDCLLRSLERSQDRALAACANEPRTSDAMGSLGKTARHVRTRLANLRGSPIVVEFRPTGTRDAQCASHAGLQGGEGKN